jgi:hypothetical protein
MTETEYKTLVDKLDLVLGGLHHLYKWTRYPARAVIAKVVEPQGYQHGRIVCLRCGHLIRARKDGSMERHDVEGKMFRGRAGGDRNRECVPDVSQTVPGSS